MLGEIWSAVGLTVIFWGIVFGACVAGALWSFFGEHKYEIRSFVMRRYRRAFFKIERRRRIADIRKRARMDKKRISAARRMRRQRQRAYRRALEFCNRGI